MPKFSSYPHFIEFSNLDFLNVLIFRERGRIVDEVPNLNMTAALLHCCTAALLQ